MVIHCTRITELCLNPNNVFILLPTSPPSFPQTPLLLLSSHEPLTNTFFLGGWLCSTKKPPQGYTATVIRLDDNIFSHMAPGARWWSGLHHSLGPQQPRAWSLSGAGHKSEAPGDISGPWRVTTVTTGDAR